MILALKNVLRCTLDEKEIIVGFFFRFFWFSMLTVLIQSITKNVYLRPFVVVIIQSASTAFPTYHEVVAQRHLRASWKLVSNISVACIVTTKPDSHSIAH